MPDKSKLHPIVQMDEDIFQTHEAPAAFVVKTTYPTIIVEVPQLKV